VLENSCIAEEALTKGAATRKQFNKKKRNTPIRLYFKLICFISNIPNAKNYQAKVFEKR
jgi:hypothetical protein